VPRAKKSEAAPTTKRTPMRATPAKAVPTGSAFVHEVKLEGMRVLARVVSQRSVLRDSERHVRNDTFPPIRAALESLAAKQALLDGVVVLLRADGTSDGRALERAVRRTSAVREAVFFAFDLLHLDGYDLRDVPLVTRKRLLAALLEASPDALPHVRLAEHVTGLGEAFFERGCALRLAGVVSKRADSRYRGGPSSRWTWVACPRATKGATKDAAEHAQDDADDATVDAKGPTEDASRGARGARARSRAPDEVHAIEASARAARPRRRSGRFADAEVAGVRVTTPERLVFPERGVTKGALAAYFAEIADAMLPHVARHPLTLVRCAGPAGPDCYYLRHARAWGPPELARVRIREKTKWGEYLYVETREALVALAQMGVVEVHAWNATIEALETPDRVVFDLDPGDGVPPEALAACARAVRAELEARGFGAFLKTTGGKGLHVVCPLLPHASWEACAAFARAIVTRVAASDPKRYTLTMSKAQRRGKIFLDDLRNRRGNTAVASYSPRARPNAPASVPLSWSELDTVLSHGSAGGRNGVGVPPGFGFDLAAAVTRANGTDPWADYAERACRLGATDLRARGGVSSPSTSTSGRSPRGSLPTSATSVARATRGRPSSPTSKGR
jgi:bifunctional non-homologous end joining protein LigD